LAIKTSEELTPVTPAYLYRSGRVMLNSCKRPLSDKAYLLARQQLVEESFIVLIIKPV